MVTQLPQKIRLKYEGKWVAWDTDTGEFLGAAKTFDQLASKVEPEAKTKRRVVGYERVIPRDAVIIGGL